MSDFDSMTLGLISGGSIRTSPCLRASVVKNS
jgi:hypothetical protein